jgi:exonuclease VII small subunit
MFGAPIGAPYFFHMKQKFLPWYLLFCAVGLSATAAYYSVIGLSIVFAGVAIPVIVMGSFLEISKIAIATYLHNAWKNTYTLLKIYLTIALVVLSVITSIGIYGLLSTGFQENIAKLEIGGKQIQNIEVKKQRFEEIKSELEKEKTTLDKDISQLRNALSTNTTTQTVDAKTGQVVTRANNANRKSFESQLTTAQASKDKISNKIDALNDSITNLDIQVLDMESKASEGNELGAIQYVSEITGADVKTVANWFIFMLIFVFDPLAITLVIATNQAFDRIKPKMNIYGEPKPIEPESQPIVDPNIETEKQNVLQEIQRVENSNAVGRKKGAILHDLYNRLSSLNDDNTKTY